MNNFRPQNRFFSFVKVFCCFVISGLKYDEQKIKFFFFAFLIFCHFLTISYFFGLVFLLWLKIQPICLKSMPNKTDYVLSISRKVQNEVWSNIQNHKIHLLLKKNPYFSILWKISSILAKIFDRGGLAWVWQEFKSQI